MSNLIEKIINPENLHWAWKKVKNSFQVGDIWYDEIELTTFEANLYDELERIKDEIQSNTYTLKPIRPLPFPKGCEKETGKPRVRQTFEISISDQVVWMAVVNVIGSSLDYKMPWWSYGHRLYVPVSKGKNGLWNIGWYRHSKGLLYRKWNQSWPLFRRNISLTAKIMCVNKSNPNEKVDDDIAIDEAEKSVLDNNTSLPNNLKSKYLDKNYWGTNSSEYLHWASIDFSKFYPKVKRDAIVKNIFKYVEGAENDDGFKCLINGLLDFRIDYSGWNKDELSEIDLDEPDKFNGLPTGLFVAGFLANVALLEVDKQISEDLEKDREIAHFRFVDDHVILAYDFEKLKEWIQKYKKYLDDANTGVEFNYEKIEPDSLSHILDPKWLLNKNAEDIKKEEELAEKKTKLDPAFPAPLMTQTLAKVSAISRSDFELLSANEEQQLIADLEHLLLTDFPDHELRKDTRVSFAASVLSRIAPNTKEDYTAIYECQKRIHASIKEYQRRFEKKDKEIFIVEKLHELIFDESLNVEEYFYKWENNIKDEDKSEDKKVLINLIKEEKIKEIELRREMFSDKESQNKYIFKLLKKALSENSEKVRIWVRVIDYCRKVGYCDISEVYDKIQELFNQKLIHSQTVSFMQTLFLNVVADRLIHSVYSILNNKCLSHREKEISQLFLESVFSNKFIKEIFDKENAETKMYYRKTYDFYKFVLGSTIYILNQTKFFYNPDSKIIKQYNLIDWNDNPSNWISKTYNPDINTWLYWLLWHTHDKSSGKPLKFWRNLQSYIDYSNPSYKPLIQPFPNYNYLPKRDDDFLSLIIHGNFDEGWLFEVFRTGKEHISQDIKDILNRQYPHLFNNIFKMDDDKINLWEFVQWQQDSLSKKFDKELDFFNHYFDPRFSEWTALEIVRQIIQETKTSGEDFFQNKINTSKLHPANFLINRDLIEDKKSIMSWNKWMLILSKQTIISTLKDYQISDERYTTHGLLELEQKVGEKAKVALNYQITHKQIKILGQNL